jgi:alpha-ketoglutarate-dependent taurine dioxygenase
MQYDRAMLDRVLEGPLAWTSATLPDGAGRITLDAACLAELDAAVGVMRANPLPVLALSPGDFALDECRRLMARVKATLDRGPGFVVLDRLPVERLPRDEVARLYWLLASMLARPVAQKWDGTMIYDVRDTGQAPGNGVRPDLTNYEQSFHTDNSYNLCPPEYVGLCCLGTAMEGGVHRVVSFLTVHNAMLREHPDLLPRLYRPFYFDRQREHAPDDVPVTHHPLFEWGGGRLTARLSRFQVVNGQKIAGQPLDADGDAALQALDDVMSRPGVAWDHEFQMGQIQFVNNRQLGHKRTAFRDWPESERRRHLVRLWLRDAGRPFYNG